MLCGINVTEGRRSRLRRSGIPIAIRICQPFAALMIAKF